MPLMKLGKNRVFATTLGHVIRFEKDKPVNVPNICIRVCEDIGAELVGKAPKGHVNQDELASQVGASINKAKAAEAISPDLPKTQPTAPGDRMEMVLSAVRTLMDRNQRGDFTAAGTANLKVLAKETGFRVDKSELKEAMIIINDPD